MAESWEWEEQHLLELIRNGEQENLHLDFKASPAIDTSTNAARNKSRSELSKDVSAFANSDGGTLVYGIVEKNHVADSLDSGYDPSVISKEWIEQVINSNIQPRISGVRIKPVPLTKSPGKVAYVVYTPRSTTAHQASDKKYYKRFNFQSVPMEDYELRDVMNRTEAPVLDLQFLLGERQEGSVQFTKTEDSICSPKIAVWLVNSSNSTPAEYSQCQVFLPSYISVTATTNYVSNGSPVVQGLSFFPSASTLTLGNTVQQGLGYFEVRLDPELGPTFPGERRALATMSFCNERKVLQGGKIILLWRTRAPRSAPQYGVVVFAPQGDQWYFTPYSISDLENVGNFVNFAP